MSTTNKLQELPENPDRDSSWKPEEAKLLKEWADKAQCNYWMHLKAHRKFKKQHNWYMIPVICISTITGTANFAQSYFGDFTTVATIIIGTMNIIAGIITTVYQFLKIAEKNEGHRSASLAWFKFYELIKTELTKNPLDRRRPKDLLKFCNDSFEHLIEMSPIVPERIAGASKALFTKRGLQFVPSVCGKLRPVLPFEDLLANDVKFSDGRYSDGSDSTQFENADPRLPRESMVEKPNNTISEV